VPLANRLGVSLSNRIRQALSLVGQPLPINQHRQELSLEDLHRYNNSNQQQEEVYLEHSQQVALSSEALEAHPHLGQMRLLLKRQVVYSEQLLSVGAHSRQL
jgi:hypothetical protein